MYNPLQQHQSYYYHEDFENGYYDQNNHHRPNQQWGDEGDSIRGGSTMTIPEPQPITSAEEPPFHPPKVLLKHMSMALRVTCEWNRRLFAGVNRTFQLFHKKQNNNNNRIRNDANLQQQQQQQQAEYPQQQPSQTTLPQDSYYSPAQQPQQQQLQLEPHGDHPVNIHPDRIWSPPIQEGAPDLEQESLTIFHALTPHTASAEEEEEEQKDGDDETANEKEEEDSSSLSETESSPPAPKGVAYWGPELLPYLEQVTSLLEIDNNGLEIALAMIYLDRACSVDTIRSNGCPPCPFCLPRTVHRLSLVSLILAKHAVNGNDPNGKTVQDYLQDLKPLGIPLDQLELMTNWMINALGENGSFVTVGQMKLWSENWEAAFFPKRHQALQQKRQEEEQRRLLQLEQQQKQREQQYYEQQQYQQQQGYNQAHQQDHQYYQ